MELLKQVAVGVVILSAIGAWWWFKYMRHGGTQGYMNKQLGLVANEQVTAMWMCYYHVELSAARQVGEALVGVRTRGINVMLALTNTGCLTLGSNENDNAPMRFERGQVTVSEYPSKPRNGSLAGPNGLEATCVLELRSAHDEPIRLEIVRSGYEAVASWGRAAAA